MKSAINGPGKPTSISAEPKNKVPETRVPNILNKLIFNVVMLFLNAEFIIKEMINAVQILSIIFGICPIGKPVVKALISPAMIPVVIVFILLGFIIREINIQLSRKSGLIPIKTGGVIACNTKPIAIKSEVITIFLVFMIISPFYK